MKHRDGFSLLELVLALAILGGSLAILSRIVDTGVSAAVESRALVQARLACQSQLAQILVDASAGLVPQPAFELPVQSFDSSATTPMVYSVEVWPAQLDGMLAIRVTTGVLGGDGSVPIAQVSLTRWIVDPALGLEQAEADQRAAAETNSSIGGSL